MVMEQTAAALPDFVMPDLACDSHCHVVGPRARFAFAAERADAAAPDATKEMLTALHRRIGVARAVIVQSALHGTDPAVTLDAVAASRGTRRGVVLAAEDISETDLAALDAGGIRGIRHNLGGAGIRDVAGFRRLAERAAPFGWHFALHMRAEQLVEHAALLRDLAIPILIDHLGRMDARGGTGQPAFRALLGLLESGRGWVKIAAVDKLSREPWPHRDIAAIAAALVRAAPERVIWGTDWPHPDGKGLRGGAMPDDTRLAALVPLYAPDAASQRKLLVDNPAVLYRFD